MPVVASQPGAVFHIFKPPVFARAPLDWAMLQRLTGKKWQYGSCGKACLYHILRATGATGKIIVPAYACQSILVPIRRLGLVPVFCDIELKDLNVSIESVETVIRRHRSKLVLVPSLYGNPANLSEMERYCQLNGLLLIDDAAQSFGAVLDGRYVGTFGKAGFFSFGPGKATAAHMGGAFWTEADYNFTRSHHCFMHYCKWINFYFNRLRVYNYQQFQKVKDLLCWVSEFLEHRVNMTADDMCWFENQILGGVLTSVLENGFAFRSHFHECFLTGFSDSRNFRPVMAARGQPNNHKLVLVARSAETAADLIRFLKRKSIFCLAGYRPLADDLSDLPRTRSIVDRVVELPMEDDREKMKFLFDALASFDLERGSAEHPEFAPES